MNAKKKCYISVPISGRDGDAVEADIIYASALVGKMGYEAVDPTSVEVQPDGDDDYAVCMGNCIRALLKCNAIFMCNGWERSKGCRAEFQVAKVYGLVRYETYKAEDEEVRVITYMR